MVFFLIKRSHKHVYLFSQLATHKECGCNCINTTGTGKLGQTYFYLKCKNCGTYFSESKILEMIEVAYKEYGNKVNVLDDLKKLKEIEKKREELARMYSEDLIGSDSYIVASAKLEEQAAAKRIKTHSHQNNLKTFSSENRVITKEIINDILVNLEIHDKFEFILFRFKKNIDIAVSYDLKYVKIN